MNMHAISHDMDFQYCEKYGLDASHLHQRLLAVGLVDEDHKVASQLHHQVIVPHFSEIVASFLNQILKQEQVRAVLDRADVIEAEKLNLTKYLLRLGMGFDSLEYIEQRLRLGSAHATRGLSLSTFICNYHILIENVRKQCRLHRHHAPEDYENFVQFLHKLTVLDISLVADVYQSAQLKSLEQSLGGMNLLASHLEQKAITDSLTGMINHDHVFYELGRRLLKAREEQSPLCIIMADIDHFKKVNDTYGHLAGDEVLKEVASRLKTSLRGFDIVGRYGGEEFMLILHSANLSTAKAIAQRIRSRIMATPVDLPDTLLDVTLSLGVALAQDSDSAESLVERADRALYRAKHNGRNQVAVAE